MKSIHEGNLGDVMSLNDCRLASPVKPMPSPEERPKEVGDLERQLRNWYTFDWLSGEQQRVVM
jgi:hypothetical protein